MKMKYIKTNLITLKCVLFLFFGAIGSLLPFLPLHMNSIGLSKDESVIVSVVAPLIAVIGPLVACLLADRFAGGVNGPPKFQTGAYLRVMIGICVLLATTFYWILLVIPPIIRSPPNVAFMCDEQGGFILQDRCGPERTCYEWGSGKGSILVKNCIFSCNASSAYTGEVTDFYKDEEQSYYNETDYLSIDDTRENEPPPESIIGEKDEWKSDQSEILSHPHMCFKNSSGDTLCEVYTEYSEKINFYIGLKRTISGNSNQTEDETCKYPFNEPFHCRITPDVIETLQRDNAECKPMVMCEIHDPYNNTDSLLRTSQCGYDNISFWFYLFIRSIGDLFLAAAVALIGTAVVIATRETSSGRGDVGKQFAAGALGFGIFVPIIGGVADGRFLDTMICFTVLMVLTVLILAFDSHMPLSPPEWWWRTKCGLLALPMSSVRKYGWETAALGVVLFLLGVFWNAIDAFLPWHVVKIDDGEPLIIGLTITVGAIPAVIFLIYAEKIVDYCGHSNILIFCFVNYIIHHLALILIDNAKLLLICEFLEIFTLHVMYITAVLYLRHLVPRKYTACGQALPIVAHFCLGRCIGALLGGIAYSEYPDNFPSVHKWFTVAAAVVACLYFLGYHFYMKPKCASPPQLPPYPLPSSVQNMNGNGNGAYMPLRVYHNGKAKKGHFRY